MPVVHAFVNGKSDGADTTITRPSNWNAEHKGAIPVFNVKTDYGCLGDGVTDDTANFQAALDAVPSGGAIVHVPFGTYELGRVNVGANTVLRGAGKGSVLHEIDDANEIISLKSGANDVVIRDFHLLGRGFTPLGVGYGIIDRNSAHERILVEGCTFTGFSAGGLHIGLSTGAPGGLCQDYIVRNCHFFDNGITNNEPAGIAITNADRVVIENCTFVNSGAAQSYISANAGIDIEPNTSGDLVTNVAIRGCHFRNIGSSAITISNTVGATVRWFTISGCTVTDNYLDGIHINYPADATVNGCVLHGNGRSGIYISGDRTILSGCEIVDNNASLGNQGQVYIENCVDTTVVGNRIGMTTATGTAPAVVEGGTADRSYIAGNNMTSAITVAVTLLGASSVAIGNTGYVGNTGRQLVKRYIFNGTVSLLSTTSGYTDFGGSFTTSVTTQTGDQVCLRVQSIFRKLSSGYIQVVVDRSGTKLPVVGTSNTSVYSDWDPNSMFTPFQYEFWDSPTAGTYTYKPQMYNSDTGEARVGVGGYCQYVVEVWR